MAARRLGGITPICRLVQRDVATEVPIFQGGIPMFLESSFPRLLTLPSYHTLLRNVIMNHHLDFTACTVHILDYLLRRRRLHRRMTGIIPSR